MIWCFWQANGFGIEAIAALVVDAEASADVASDDVGEVELATVLEDAGVGARAWSAGDG